LTPVNSGTDVKMKMTPLKKESLEEIFKIKKYSNKQTTEPKNQLG
jgi:hypothetical protein